MTSWDLYVTCPRGAERPLAGELRSFGASGPRPGKSGVSCSGTLETAYRAVLWSRVASRVLLRIAEGPVSSAADVYAAAREVEWERHMRADGTLAVDFIGALPDLRNTMFGAQRVKDAVADRFRELSGVRPGVDTASPDLRINASVHGRSLTLAIDLSGDALHRRGYRVPGRQAEAPLKENLAAAVLLLAGWQLIAEAGGPLMDPFCGGGTLPIEAALLAGDVAPGLLRESHRLERWLGHDPELWARLLAEAGERREAGRERVPAIRGSDADRDALAIAAEAAARAGVGEMIEFAERDVADIRPPETGRTGLVVTNPPYGERLTLVRGAYASLGWALSAGFAGWRVALLARDESLATDVGVPWDRSHALRNGPIEVKLHVGTVPGEIARPRPRPAGEARQVVAHEFANRLRKNHRHLGKWARREGVSCFRVYDADLPDFALAIDRYEGAGPDEGRAFAHVAEYAPPAGVDPALAEARLDAAVRALPEVLEVAPGDVFVKVRRRQRGTSQYDRTGERSAVHVVSEGGSLFEVDLAAYLDTGLFLDHRPLRLRVRAEASGRRFLNLFGYTGAFTVHAAAGGASASTTVDLSATYLDWARRNMGLNGLASPEHEFVRADALRWLAEAASRPEERFGLIVCDPPSFSNSKRMEGVLDVQRDHAALVRGAYSLLAPGGILYFSTNLRSFAMDPELAEGLAGDDITPATIPPDFARTPGVHACWRFARG